MAYLMWTKQQSARQKIGGSAKLFSGAGGIPKKTFGGLKSNKKWK